MWPGQAHNQVRPRLLSYQASQHIRSGPPRWAQTEKLSPNQSGFDSWYDYHLLLFKLKSWAHPLRLWLGKTPWRLKWVRILTRFQWVGVYLQLIVPITWQSQSLVLKLTVLITWLVKSCGHFCGESNSPKGKHVVMDPPFGSFWGVFTRWQWVEFLLIHIPMSNLVHFILLLFSPKRTCRKKT